ncbi:MAG: DUF459 domain-containing protein [Spirochaetales bacterium]|nr:MAG: DUF459 domain-containing protein [Spirochaetales bacterium]
MKKSFYNLAGIIFIAFLLSLFLNAKGIGTWAARVKREPFRSMMVSASIPFTRIGEITGITAPWAAVRERFSSWVKGVPPSPPIPLSKGSRTYPVFLERYYRILRGDAPKPKTVFSDLRPLEILVAGDSLAWLHIPAMLIKEFKDNPAVRITSVSKISSNFSDPSYFDWHPGITNLYNEKIEKDGKRYDCLIMIIGANDAQAIYMDGAGYPFDSPAWHKEFENRVRRYVDIITPKFRKIYWVAIPPMRKEGYKDRMVTVNGLYERICADYPSITYVQVKDLLGNENGLYVDAKIIDGRQQVIRSVDGIHYDYAGGQLVAGRIEGLIERDFEFIHGR